MGTLGLGWAIGAGLGPIIGGIIYDNMGNYLLAFVIMAVVMLMRASLIILIKREVNIP